MRKTLFSVIVAFDAAEDYVLFNCSFTVGVGKNHWKGTEDVVNVWKKIKNYNDTLSFKHEILLYHWAQFYTLVLDLFHWCKYFTL